MGNSSHTGGMRVSFDLDEVLFVSPLTNKTEPELPFPLNCIFRERLRLGAPELIRRLQDEGFEVWVYTSSFRSIRYIQHLFYWYGVTFDGIVNANRHMKEVQRNRKELLPSKMPNHYRISLHIDDETVVANNGKQYGFNVYQLDQQDEQWAQSVMDKVYEIKRREKYQN